ncbi:uncharacterized protein [Coffea arabica]|uniref:F-box domain-containing protein n=1 Tax=Coffea arabica TaxID=13443 RepID=A0ABM4UDN5_COFAR
MVEGQERPLPQQFPAPGKYPWLLYRHGKGYNDLTFCTISPSGPVKSERKRIPELIDKTVVYCSEDGWLVLADIETKWTYSIWNPATSQCFDLPRLKSKLLFIDSFLSSPPTDPGCLVMLFVAKAPIILYCRPGDQEWTEFNYGESLKAQTSTTKDSRENFLCQPVSCNGRIYATSARIFCLMRINLDKESNTICGISLLNQQRPPWYHFHSVLVNLWLVGSGDELFSVHSCYGSLDFCDTLTIEINKFNFPSNLWEKVTSLNGRTLFLGEHYSFSCPGPMASCDSDSDMEEAGRGSCIYFTDRFDATLYSYKIEDESITTYLPCPDLPKPWLLFPTWIMPVQRSEHHTTTKEDEEMLPQENNVEVNNSSAEIIEEEGRLCDLPPDMLAMVCGNLSFVDYMNFRCLNRICASTVRMKSNSLPRPFLIFSNREKGVYEIVESRLQGKHSVTVPEAIEDHTIRYAKDGWLLLDKRNSVALFNLYTKEIIRFPDTPRECYTSFVFTSLPSSAGCFVFASLGVDKEVCFHHFKMGEQEWRQVGFGQAEIKFQPGFSSPLLHGGTFYYLSKDGILGGLKLEAETDNDIMEMEEDGNAEVEDGNYVMEWRINLDLERPCKNFRRTYLVECDENLLSVFEGRRGNRVWIRVYKLINDEQNWQEMNSLGNYSLYLSRYSSIARLEESPDMANRIYFPRFYQGGLLYYSLSTKKYHSVGSDDLLDNFFGTTMYNDCAWVDPRRR